VASTVRNLKSFLAGAGRFAQVRVAGTKGSTPRETGTWMLVSMLTTYGTIGGGQLEYMAIDKARQVLGRPDDASTMLDVPLGPEIGQCCGGRVEVEIRLGDDELASALIREAEQEEAGLPHFYIFGGGHVGKAIAAAVALLPVRAIVVETRANELEGISPGVETMLTPMPEEAVRAAPAGSAFAILTHDHALDFLIVAEALKRSDAAYVGMIGSKTKKATFRSWFLKTAGGTEMQFARLISPIGGEAVRDKRPAVIAALAAAEIMSSLAFYVVGQRSLSAMSEAGKSNAARPGS
jgi:xanthine dehydrogenase accessory factor